MKQTQKSSRKRFFTEEPDGGTSATNKVVTDKALVTGEERSEKSVPGRKNKRFRDKSPPEKMDRFQEDTVQRTGEFRPETHAGILRGNKKNRSHSKAEIVKKVFTAEAEEGQAVPQDEGYETVRFAKESGKAVWNNQASPWLNQHAGSGKKAYQTAVRSAKELEQQLNRNITTANPVIRSVQKRRNYYTARKKMGLRSPSILNNTLTHTVSSISEGFQPVRRMKGIWNGLKVIGGGLGSLFTGAAGGLAGLVTLSPIIIVPVIVLFTFSWMFHSGDPYVNSTYVNKAFFERIQEMIEAYNDAPNTKVFPGISMPESNREVVLDNEPVYTLNADKLTALFMAYIGSDYDASYAALKMNEWFDELYHVDSHVVHEQRNCRVDPTDPNAQICDDVPVYHLSWTEEISSDSEFDAFAREVLRTAPRQDLDYAAVLQQYENYIEEYGGIQVFMNPLGPGKAVGVNSPWGFRNLSGQAPFHNGVDLNVSMRTPLYAIYDGGVVKEAGWIDTGGGNTVGVLYNVDGENYYVRYCHMDQITCAPGNKVNIGTQLGYSGSTGNSTGPHLHLEVWKGTGAYGLNKSINPLYIVQNTAY